jgi:diguanylate cyclase (GGDEF)-like protein
MHDDDPLGVVVSFFGRGREFDDEERQLHQALARQAAEALQRVRLQEQLRYQARHDQLTGLVNRCVLYDRLREASVDTARSGRPIALLFLDLDGFKPINDQLGHLVGDQILLEVAHRLRRTTRLSETVARFGGDEFVVLNENADVSAAQTLAHRIRAAVRRPLDEAPGFALTASVGVAVQLASDGTADPEQLVRVADDAMYRSKSRGGDCETVIQL